MRNVVKMKELQQFLSKHKDSQNGVILNFGTENIEHGISIKQDKVYLRKDVAEALIDLICMAKTP